VAVQYQPGAQPTAPTSVARQQQVQLRRSTSGPASCERRVPDRRGAPRRTRPRSPGRAPWRLGRGAGCAGPQHRRI
jgi:hypothetical protein